MFQSRLRLASSVGGSPGRCFLNNSTKSLLHRAYGVLLECGLDEGVAVEEVEDLLIGALGEESGVVPGPGRIDARQRAQKHSRRQLALAVDAHGDRTPLVDLELQPRAASRHEVGDENLLRGVLGSHDVGARRAHELGDDHALGAVDDEGALLGHHGEVAHEDVLLPYLPRLPVDEADGNEQGRRVGLVFVAAFFERKRRVVELVFPEFDCVVAGVVLDGRYVIDGLSQALSLEPLERFGLDCDEVGKV